MSRDEVKSGCPTDKAGPRQNQSEYGLVKEAVGLGRVIKARQNKGYRMAEWGKGDDRVGQGKAR